MSLQLAASEPGKSPIQHLDLARKNSAQSRRLKADEFVRAVVPHIKKARATGNKSLRDIAEFLNEVSGVHSPRGGRWDCTQVRRIIVRAKHLRILFNGSRSPFEAAQDRKKRDMSLRRSAKPDTAETIRKLCEMMKPEG